MNLSQNPTMATTTNAIDRLVTELSDRTSLWYDLRVAEMAGCDYVFAPDAVCQEFNQQESLQRFLQNILSILASGRGRLVLLSYWHDQYRQLHFEKYSFNASDSVTTWSKELLDQSRQLDFIRTLFEHSERLVE